MKVYDLIVVNGVEGTAYNSGPASYEYEAENSIALFKVKKDAKRWIRELKKIRKKINIIEGKYPKNAMIDDIKVDFSWVAFVNEYKIVEREVM